MQFSMRIISKNFIENEIKNTGFSTDYLAAGLNKHKFLSLKIQDLKAVEANILKQTALSCDCDCALHRHSIDCKVEKTDCVLSGSYSQLKEVSKKLKIQPFSLPKVGCEILNMINCDKKQNNAKIMGILNLTQNSFSDGGEYFDFPNACKRADELIEQGADIIDIGAESTRPGSKAVESDFEIQKITPVLNYLKENYPKIPVSIDTRNAQTAVEMLNLGAQIINDVSGLRYDKNMAKIAADFGCKIVIMHSRSNPCDMDDYCNYKNLLDEVYNELQKCCDSALNAGVKPENIIIDPGFGFAKNYEQNIEMLSRIEEFKSMGYELLAGVSRKRFLQRLAGVDTPKDADDISAISGAYLALKGVNYLRVHNVEKTLCALKFARAINV